MAESELARRRAERAAAETRQVNINTAAVALAERLYAGETIKPTDPDAKALLRALNAWRVAGGNYPIGYEDRSQ